MGNIKQINIKNHPYYFLNYMINIKNFNPNLLKIYKSSYKDIDIYYTGYIPIKDIGDYESTHSGNPLYFNVGEVNRYIEVKNRNKYLVFFSVDKSKEVLKKYADI